MSAPITVFHIDDGKGLRGGQRQMLYLVKELARLGVSSRVVCRRGSQLETAALRRDLEVIPLPLLVEPYPLSAFLLRRAVKRELKAGRRVVVHAHTSHAVSAAWLASAGLPVLRVVHRRVYFPPGTGLSHRLKYGRAHLVIALSEAVKNVLIGSGVPAARIKVINSTIDLEDTPWKEEEYDQYRLSAKRELALKFDLPSDTVWLGSLIALEDCKDPVTLLHAAETVIRKHPEAHYLLAGKGPLEGQVRRLLRKLGIESNFHLTGHYPRPYEMLAALDIFVLPSREEGFGSVLIEAMNARAAIVATRAGGIPDAVTDGDNGLLVPPGDPEELAAAQLRLIEDKGLRERLVESGLRRRLDLSSPRMAEKTLRAYERAFEDTFRD